MKRLLSLEGLAIAGPLAVLAFWAVGYVRGERDYPAIERKGTPYIGSQECAACHPRHHESWAATYHRTMTQMAGPTSVLPRIDGEVSMDLGGGHVVLRRDGDETFVRLPWLDGSVREMPIRFTIGSRRMQQYAVEQDGRVYRIPVFYDIEDQSFRHINEAFFRRRSNDPAAFTNGYALWNANCIFCHNTRPNPGLEPGTQRFRSDVAELGIACEECHGPGALHSELQQNPLRRAVYRLWPGADRSITHPARPDSLRSTQVCGQCHGQRLPRPLERIGDLMRHGDPYTPGEDLFGYYKPLERTDTIESYKQFYLRFWKDGSPRLTAYEMQGLLDSKCFQEAAWMSCVSCHQGHGGDPKGMITPEMRTNAACTGCHAQYARQDEAGRHARHRPDSASCYDCHMPEVVYGVLTAHPTHLIRNPEPERSVRYNMPNACNLCHLDRSVNWAIREQERLWGRPGERGGTEFDQPELVRAIAQGDVVYRTLAVHHARKRRAQDIDGLLLAALEDPYYSVRRFAARALDALHAGPRPSGGSEPGLEQRQTADAWESKLRAAGVEVPAELRSLRRAAPQEEPFEFGE